MLPEKYRWIEVQFEPGDGDPELLLEIARKLEREDNLEGAATVYDRAYGLAPHSAEVREGRQRVLQHLAVVEHGIPFRYVPGGVFLMGCHEGEPDERPWHPVLLSPYWMSATPISWATYCLLMDWTPPPGGFPRTLESTREGSDRTAFHLREENKVRLQYCEDQTTRASTWPRHMPTEPGQPGGQSASAQALFGTPPRKDPQAPWRYETKPMIAVSWQEAQELADRLSTTQVRYGLPTEAQWEKAARGGLIGARFSWGNDSPTHDRCDFDRFTQFSILPVNTLPPNGYGLYSVNGCVWEWTRDWYDHDYYRESPPKDPEGPPEGEEKVLRGGSWTDCAEAVTVTFRMSRGSRSWRDGSWGRHLTPNIGFRLCRTVLS
jgi:formylglycine-generating enzyme required for sulfatase activity